MADIERHTNVYYEYISIPDELVETYSEHVFENVPKEYHITTRFKPDYDLSEHYGYPFHFRVIAYGTSEDAEAVKVELLDTPDWFNTTQKVMHVTLSFRVKPVDSNYITDWCEVEDENVYEGIFKGKIFDKPKLTESITKFCESVFTECENIEYSNHKGYRANDLINCEKEMITDPKTGWQEWVQKKNPEPDKLHNKFAKEEKEGIYYGHCVPGICDAN